ncbi:MAG: hypothetical protein WC565_03080 [Parcubacteria group bacterium]
MLTAERIDRIEVMYSAAAGRWSDLDWPERVSYRHEVGAACSEQGISCIDASEVSLDPSDDAEEIEEICEFHGSDWLGWDSADGLREAVRAALVEARECRRAIIAYAADAQRRAAAAMEALRRGDTYAAAELAREAKATEIRALQSEYGHAPTWGDWADAVIAASEGS